MASGAAIQKEIRHHTVVSSAGKQQKVLNTLHLHLDCIDSKTSALLTYDALLIAIFSFVVGSTDLRHALPQSVWWHGALVLSAGMTVASAALCLLGLDIIGAHSDRDSTVDDYIKLAAQVSVGRTGRYRVALLLTGLSSFIVLLTFLISVGSVL